jgi:hypothetical protein
MLFPGFRHCLFSVVLTCMIGSREGIAMPVADTVAGGPSISINAIPGGPNDSVSCVIPFSRAGNLILLKAKADSTEGNFILDTGSPYLVLNLTYFRDYPATQLAEEDGGMAGTNSHVLRTTVNHLSFDAINYYRVEANLVNLGHIENSKGVKILGLLGMQLFRQFEMIIDYDKNMIYLHRIGKKEATVYMHEMLRDTSAYRVIPIDIINDRVLARTEIAGKKLRLMIDFAAESNVLDSRLPDKVFENVAITRRIILNGIGGKKVEALYGDLSSMKIGNQETGVLPVLITNLEKTCFSYESCIDGILGFDFLSLHKIGFNFVNRKMYIWK